MPRSPIKPTSIPGFGFIYRPTYRSHGALKQQAVWWMQFKTDSKPVRKSTGRTSQEEAFVELMKAAGKRASGEITDAAPERVRVGQLLDMLLADYRHKATLYDLKCRIEKHLRPRFGSMRAMELRKRDLARMADELAAANLAPATVNRCLANLHRAFVLGAREDPPLVLRIPDFPWQTERDNVRSGIVEPDTYRALLAELPPHARLVLVIAYHTGMRRGEILGLRWDQVDLAAGVIHLEAKQTKNRTRRDAPIYGEMGPCLEMARAERDEKYPDCRWVVQFNGCRVFDIKTAWSAACERLGLQDRPLVHDLRRTALSNMDEAGVPRETAMRISGHKTEAVYRRYLIGSARQVTAAGKTMERFFEGKQAEGGTEKRQ